MLSESNCQKRHCRYFLGLSEPQTVGGDDYLYVCKAFPKGIPEEIAFGDNPHTKPVEGDHGIQFEPVKKAK